VADVQVAVRLGRKPRRHAPWCLPVARSSSTIDRMKSTGAAGAAAEC
jgi:hypothetical protein